MCNEKGGDVEMHGQEAEGPLRLQEVEACGYGGSIGGADGDGRFPVLSMLAQKRIVIRLPAFIFCQSWSGWL